MSTIVPLTGPTDPLTGCAVVHRAKSSLFLRLVRVGVLGETVGMGRGAPGIADAGRDHWSVLRLRAGTEERD